MACADADSVAAALVTAAAGFRSAEADGQRAESHPIPDLIALHQYVSALCAAETRTRGLRFNSLTPGGTVTGRRRYTRSWERY